MELVATLLDRLTSLLRTHGKGLAHSSTHTHALLPRHECFVLGPSELSELRSGNGYRKEWSVDAGMLQLADLSAAKLLPPMPNSTAILRKSSTGSNRSKFMTRASIVSDDWEEEEEGEDEDEDEEVLDSRRLVFLLNLFNLMTAHALIEQHQRLATAAATPVSAGGSSARLLDVLSLQRSARYQLRDVSLTLSMIEHTLIRVSGTIQKHSTTQPGCV